MTKMQALHNFWSSFGLKAYDENSVPAEMQLPYLTYEVADDSFDHTMYVTASLWYRARGWLDIDAKAEQIAEYISPGGKIVEYDKGAFWIRKAHPWSQRLSWVQQVSDTSYDTIRRIVLNVMIEFIDR